MIKHFSPEMLEFGLSSVAAIHFNVHGVRCLTYGPLGRGPESQWLCTNKPMDPFCQQCWRQRPDSSRPLPVLPIQSARPRQSGQTAQLDNLVHIFLLCKWLSDVIRSNASGPVSYTHLTLPTILGLCRSRWSPYH